MILSTSCNMNIREAKLEDAAAIAKVHVDSWQTTYRDLLPKDYIEKRTYEKRKNNWQNRLSSDRKAETSYCIYVAKNAEDRIVGFIDGGLARGDSAIYKGEIYALYILEAYQRRGIGKSLVRSIASRLFQLGLTSIMVWVLEENPAIQFYQALGGQRINQRVIKIGGKKFLEIAYGWTDTQNLITK